MSNIMIDEIKQGGDINLSIKVRPLKPQISIKILYFKFIKPYMRIGLGVKMLVF